MNITKGWKFGTNTKGTDYRYLINTNNNDNGNINSTNNVLIRQ